MTNKYLYKAICNFQLRGSTEERLRENINKIFGNNKVIVYDVTDTLYSIVGDFYHCDFMVKTTYRREDVFIKMVGIKRSDILFF